MTNHPAQAVLGLAIAFAVEDLAHTLDAYDAGSWSLVALTTLLLRRQQAITRLVEDQVEDSHLGQVCRLEVEAVYAETLGELRTLPQRRSRVGRMADLSRRSHDLRAGVAAYVAGRQRAILVELRGLGADDAGGP